MAAPTISRRTGALLAAAVLALLATGALVSYVRALESEAFRGADPVEVWVAAEAIPQGTSGEAAVARGAIAQTTLPRKAVAEGVLEDPDQIRGKVAAVAILPGEQILVARFVDSERARGALAIPDNRHAMSVEVAIPPGVAGFVQPGDRVGVIARLDAPGPEGRAEPRAQFILQNIEVLAVGQRTTLQESEDGGREVAQQRVLLTVAVTPNQAEQLAFGILQGDIWFTLLPPEGTAAETPGRTAQNVFR